MKSNTSPLRFALRFGTLAACVLAGAAHAQLLTGAGASLGVGLDVQGALNAPYTGVETTVSVVQRLEMPGPAPATATKSGASQAQGTVRTTAPNGAEGAGQAVVLVEGSTGSVVHEGRGPEQAAAQRAQAQTETGSRFRANASADTALRSSVAVPASASASMGAGISLGR